jgi:glycosyltransferase involved in cell wall biosynthesis
MKIACVIHRFGTDFAGGSEGHCRAIATRLAARHQVTILTTCAKDHITWRNEYPEGRSELGPLTVERFPVVRARSMHRFADISDVVFSGAGSDEDEEEWFRENGPESPALLDHLKQHAPQYDRVLFWAFRYYNSYFGVPLVPGRNVLVPTAEEDPLIRTRAAAQLFPKAAAFIFLTPEEQALVAEHCACPLPASVVIGSGLEPATRRLDADQQLHHRGIRQPFALYLGRIDPNKGCETLVRHFIRYAGEQSRPLQLVMAGPVNMPLPEHPSVVPLGFVEDRMREALLSSASVLIAPSPYESLSLALLEAWNYGVPALVNARCDVLRGQVLRANGGLSYRNFDEFARELSYLLDHQDEARQIGAQGFAYVEREYRWPHVMEKLETFLASLK